MTGQTITEAGMDLGPIVAKLEHAAKWGEAEHDVLAPEDAAQAALAIHWLLAINQRLAARGRAMERERDLARDELQRLRETLQ